MHFSQRQAARSREEGSGLASGSVSLPDMTGAGPWAEHRPRGLQTYSCLLLRPLLSRMTLTSDLNSASFRLGFVRDDLSWDQVMFQSCGPQVLSGFALL